MIRMARPNRRTRASVFGDSPICSRNCSIRCRWLNPTSSTRVPMLMRPPVWTSRHHAHRTAARRLFRRQDARGQLAVQDGEPRLPGRRIVQLHDQAARVAAQHVFELDRAVLQLAQRAAKKERAPRIDRLIWMPPDGPVDPTRTYESYAPVVKLP
jgi:hypothetical protein